MKVIVDLGLTQDVPGQGKCLGLLVVLILNQLNQNILLEK